jgi:hypothetical protein
MVQQHKKNRQAAQQIDTIEPIPADGDLAGIKIAAG